jgi:sporulation protein YlmC with PRC-barrel domain
MHRAFLTCATACLGFVAFGLAEAPKAAPARTKQIVPLTSEALYRGWRASRLLASRVAASAGRDLGTVRNLLIGKDSQLEALVVEGRNAIDRRATVFRIPWEKVSKSGLPSEIIADVTNGARPEHRRIRGTPALFSADDIIGDYARLRNGRTYGHVFDVVFTQRGRMFAIVVIREPAAGGGIYALGLPGLAERWDPSRSHYDLPYLTVDQANEAAIPVDLHRFHTTEAG